VSIRLAGKELEQIIKNIEANGGDAEELKGALPKSTIREKEKESEQEYLDRSLASVEIKQGICPCCQAEGELYTGVCKKCFSEWALACRKE